MPESLLLATEYSVVINRAKLMIPNYSGVFENFSSISNLTVNQKAAILEVASRFIGSVDSAADWIEKGVTFTASQ